MIRNTSLLILLCGLFTSCLDPIDLEVDKGFRETVAISGKLTKGDPSRVTARVARLFDFLPDSRRIIFAQEVLIRDEYSHALPLKVSAQETYSLQIPADHPEFRVDYFEKYQLEVLLSDGRRYLSEFEQLLPVPRIDSIRPRVITKLIVDRVQDYRPALFLAFDLDSPIAVNAQTGNSKLRWDFEGTFEISSLMQVNKDSLQTCYITQKVDLFRPQSFDGTTIAADRMDGFLLNEEIANWRFAQGYVLHTYQESLTNTAFSYWENVQSSVLRSGDMFEPAAGNLQTNFSNPADPADNVTGFFYATEIDTFRVYIDPAFVSFPDSLCHPPPAFPPCVCIDCLVEPRSTGVRPSFFPF